MNTNPQHYKIYRIAYLQKLSGIILFMSHSETGVGMLIAVDS